MKLDNEVSRKEFLKFTGLATFLGVAGTSAFGIYANTGGQTEEEASKNKVRFGMVIDTRKCKDNCTDCIDSCKFEHNVPDFENKKDEIKWIWKEPAKHLFGTLDYSNDTYLDKKKPMLTLCNHCANPACVRVCPTQATWKRKDDGIVMMDYHRCIGCRFCMAACPYGSRSFNWQNPRKGLKNPNPNYPTRTTGVVEKCNFCEEITSDGKLPHCVTSCKEGAITFGNLNDPNSDVRKLLNSNLALRRKADLGTGPSVYYII